MHCVKLRNLNFWGFGDFAIWGNVSVCLHMDWISGHSVSTTLPFPPFHFTSTMTLSLQTFLIKKQIWWNRNSKNNNNNNIWHLKLLRTVGISFSVLHVSGNHWIWFTPQHVLFFFSLYTSVGKTAPCSPSILCLPFSPQFPPEDPFLISSVSLISADWASKENCIILRFVSFLWLLDVAFVFAVVVSQEALRAHAQHLSSLQDRSWFTSVGAKVKLSRGSLLL